jgi:hypothetical protein
MEGENGLKHLMNNWTNWCIHRSIGKQFEKNLEKKKQKKLSTQPQDNLEIQVIHPQAQIRNVKLKAMHLKPNHQCMQEQLNQCLNS